MRHRRRAEADWRAARVAARHLSAWSLAHPAPMSQSVDLRAAAERMGDRRLRAARRLAGRARALLEITPKSILNAPGAPLGPAWTGHPALQRRAPGQHVPLHERQITEAMADVLAARGRARGFVQLLCELGGRDDLLSSLTVTTRVRVEAEVPLQQVSRHQAQDRRRSIRRMDLVFRWRPEADREAEAVAVVEVKLGAPIGPGQLKAYGAEARKLARGSGLSPGLFLVGNTPPPHRELPPAWRFLSWATVMRRWEGRLATAGDDDLGFAALRAQLWRRCGLMGET